MANTHTSHSMSPEFLLASSASVCLMALSLICMFFAAPISPLFGLPALWFADRAISASHSHRQDILADFCVLFALVVATLSMALASQYILTATQGWSGYDIRPGDHLPQPY